ncbi:hypothetical protein OG874_13340 [Nocardia sp. NBC_00565]|uniref:hypothetical protein n=1 Tax=Nocardia sp. NBC_00565 TaxID=2975993 RepID=UPI002E7FDA79|nr:hypothetical protein [Nocardia sp. NBC_00565]WUC06054.1 hypothetical protein OG874_13340 [Nocardia sp. NBC_00565]
MSRAMLKVIAVGAISLAIGVQPAIAAAVPDVMPLEPALTARTETTAPFDPICPLCFLRELIESGSSR